MTIWEKLERTRFLIAPNTHRPGLCCWIFCFLVPITYIIRALTTMNGTMVGIHAFYWIIGIARPSRTGTSVPNAEPVWGKEQVSLHTHPSN